MTKKISLTLLALLMAVVITAQEKSITLHTPTGNIEGTFTWPASAKKAPVVLFISGSGPTDRDGNNPQMKNNSLKILSDSLVRHGIATLRFDKRGIAASTPAGPKEADMRIENYMDDVQAWTRELAANKQITAITIAGHSEGSLIGMVAAQNNQPVKAFISISGAGVPADVMLKTQIANQPQALKDMVFPIIDKLKQGDTIANIPPMLNTLLRPSVQPYLISWFRYNPQTEIAKLKIPVLIIQGDKDIQVATSDYEKLTQAAPNARKALIPGMNHVLKTCPTTDQIAQMQAYTDPGLPVPSELVKTMVSFIKTVK